MSIRLPNESGQIADHAQRAFNELFGGMNFIFDKSLTTEELTKKTKAHGDKVRQRASELEETAS